MGINSGELVLKIEALNKQVMQLNGERQRQLGQLEATKKQFDASVENYKNVYGVQLTAEILGEEYNRVLNETNAEAQKLEEQIQYITSGAYKQEKVTQTVSVQGVTTPNIPAPTASAGFKGFEEPKKEELPFDPDPPKATGVGSGSYLDDMVRAAANNVAPTVQPVNTAPVQPVNTAPVVNNVAPTNNTMQTSQPVPNVPPSGFGATAAPVQPVQVAQQPMSEAEANMDKPITPVGWGTPAPQVSGEQVNSQLANMFGGKFGV